MDPPLLHAICRKHSVNGLRATPFANAPDHAMAMRHHLHERMCDMCFVRAVCQRNAASCLFSAPVHMVNIAPHTCACCVPAVVG